MLLILSGNVKLADFTHCDVKCKNLLLLLIVNCLLVWMAPEHLHKNELGLPLNLYVAYIWLLGCTIIEMATRNPTSGSSQN